METIKKSNQNFKIVLLIDECFGALGTGYGDYGFLARRLVAKCLNNRITLAKKGIEYIKEVHNIPKFINDITDIISKNKKEVSFYE